MATKHTIDIHARDKTGNTFKSIGGKLSGLTVAAAGVAASVAAIGMAIKGTLDAVDALGKRIDKLNVTSNTSKEIFQVFNEAMEQGGISAETFDRGLRQLYTRVNQGATGTGGYADAVSRLGNVIFDQNGNIKDSVQLMTILAHKVDEGTMSFNDFSKLVGEKAGPEIMSVLKKLTEGTITLEEAMQKMAEDATIVSPETMARAAVLNDRMKVLGNRLFGVRVEIMQSVMPALENMVNFFIEHFPKIRDTVGNVIKFIIDYVLFMTDKWRAGFYLIRGITKVVFGGIATVVAETINFMGRGITDFARASVQAFENLYNTVIGFANSIGIAMEKIDFSSNLNWEDMTFGTQMLEEGMNDLGNSIRLTKREFGYATKEWGNAAEKLDMNAKIADHLATSLEEGVAPAVTKVNDTLSEGTVKLGDYNKELNKVSMSLSEQFVEDIAAGKSALDSLRNFLGQTLKKMAAMVLQQNVMAPLINSFANVSPGFKAGIQGGQGVSGSLASMGANFISRIFSGGFRANGGTIGAGQLGVVGENGPEIVRGPATVTSNRNSTAMLNNGGGDTFNVYYNLNAIDSKSGTEFLAQHNKELVAIIDKQRNRRGLGGITR